MVSFPTGALIEGDSHDKPCSIKAAGFNLSTAMFCGISLFHLIEFFLFLEDLERSYVS